MRHQILLFQFGNYVDSLHTMSPKRGMKYCRRHRYVTPDLPANGDSKPCLRRDTKS
ncbi:hypothetical protein CBM2633_B10618 [Cupriavidus taiwanensis]|nr:hypothetical protein CBM2633_B10618 [Cupriavidus taiwanensis]